LCFMNTENLQAYQHFISQATNTVKKAISVDTAGNYTDAINLYVSATMLYMKAIEYVDDEEFKKRVKVEVSKYLQRAQDLRNLQKQNIQQTQTQSQLQTQQQLQQMKQVQQHFKEQHEQLKLQLHAPPPSVPSQHPQLHQQPETASQQKLQQQQQQQEQLAQHPKLQPNVPQTNTKNNQLRNAEPRSKQENSGLLGSLFSKWKQTPATTKKQTNTNRKAAKRARPQRVSNIDDTDSDDDVDGNDDGGNGDADDGGDADVANDKDSDDAGEHERETKTEADQENEDEYFSEIPDEETLKTIDRLLVEEEKRVNEEVKQSDVVDNKIAEKIAMMGFGMGLMTDDDVDLDDEALEDVILESRISDLLPDEAPESK